MLLLDIDGTLTRHGGTPEVTVPGGSMRVDPAVADAVRAMGVQLVWATDRGASERSGLAAAARLRVDDGLDPGDDAGLLGWWKLDALAVWLRRNPHVRRLAWADDELGTEDAIGVPYRDTAADVLAHAGVEHLLVCPASGLTPADLATVADFFGVARPADPSAESGPALAPAPPAAVAEPPNAPLTPRVSRYLPSAYAGEEF
ncbi:hypothetical protein HF998_02195 [Cellulomonas hominis]|nr:hypothetical protein [Cellulomonas hominis]